MIKTENGVTINQDDFIRLLSKRLGVPNYEAIRVFQIFRDLLVQCMIENINFKIVGLGTLGTRIRKGRKFFNQLTGREVDIPDKRVVYFKSSAELNRRLNENHDDTEE